MAFTQTELDQERERAREIYQHAVNVDPMNADAWLKLSYAAQDPRLALEYVQRAVDLKPDDLAIQAGLCYILFTRLKDDPYVEFLAETDKNYVVTVRNSRPVVIPKSRANSEIYPPPRLTDAERVAQLVGWMALGLVPAGLGAFVLAPVVIRRAWGLLRKGELPVRDRRIALVSLALASCIGLAGEVLFGLLLLHWLG